MTGQEAHAGPTPMPLRKDALVAAARMIDAINRLGHAFPPYACATVGFVDASPNSRNTIPGRVFFTVDLRHPDDATLAAMNDRLRAEFAEIAEAAGCTVDIVDFWQFPAQPFDEDCVSAVRSAAEQGGHAWRDIVSGAGHDAVYIARIAPTGMIFIPCETASATTRSRTPPRRTAPPAPRCCSRPCSTGRWADGGGAPSPAARGGRGCHEMICHEMS